jgi:hypothetical protein
MGRARRDRRDAERKSRAKRRRKNDNTSDYYSSGDEEAHIPHIHYTTKTERPIKATDTTEEEKSSKRVVPIADSSELVTDTPSIKSDGEHKETSKSEEGHIQTEATPTTKKPLDKIERMRQKKQLQKARRKEKKAAREAAAAVASK